MGRLDRKAIKKVSRLTTKDEERALALRMYSESRLPVEEIGRIFGVSRQTVQQWVRDAGVEKRGPMGPRKRTDSGEFPIVTEQIMAQADTQQLERRVAALEDRILLIAEGVAENRGMIQALLAQIQHRQNHDGA